MTETSRRVLYIAHRTPHPPDKGDRIRNYNVLKALAARGEVWLLALADEPVSPDSHRELDELCKRVRLVPCDRFGKVRALWSALTGGSLSAGNFHHPELLAAVREWSEEAGFHAVVVSTTALVPYLRVDELAKVRKVVDSVDVDSQKWFDFAAASRFPKNLLYRFEGKRIRKLELEALKISEAVAFVSPAEAALFDAIAGAGAGLAALNGVDLDYFHPVPTETERPAAVFVGALDYLPNVDAAIWYANEVHPKVRKEFPTAEFRIVGRKPVKSLLDLTAIPGVDVVGQVPDVRPYQWESAFVVAPMRLSRGLQNKVIEAMALGKAVVAAPPATAALAAVSGRDYLSATTVDQWTEAVVELLRHPARRRELGLAARTYVEQQHNWETGLRPLVDKVFCTQEIAP